MSYTVYDPAGQPSATAFEVVSTCISPSERDELRELARQNERSVSAQVRLLVRRALRDERQREPAAA